MPLNDDLAQMVPTIQSHWGQDWVTEGLLTNPVTNALFADTGELAEGWYDFTIIYTSDAAGKYPRLEHRNAANTANVHYTALGVAAHNFCLLYINNWRMETDERMRMICIADQTGTTQGSILWTKRLI